VVINKFCCCFETNSKGLYSANVFKRYLGFVRKFIIFNNESLILEKLELFKILKKNVFLLFKEMLTLFVIEKERYSVILFIKFLFEESIDILLRYKLISLIYTFDKRGNKLYLLIR
jgi:hypothetical protein